MDDMTQVLGDVIARSIHAATAPLMARIALLEAKEVAPVVGPPGPPGKDIDPIFVKSLVAEAVGALPPPKPGEKGDDGKSVDVADVQAMVDAAIKALPKPKDGERGEDGKSVDPLVVKSLVAEAVAALPVPKGEKGDKGDPGSDGAPGEKGESVKGDPGPPGKDADPLQLKSLQDDVTRLREEVIVLKSIPAPKDGKDGTPGAKGDPGQSVTGGIVDKTGNLILTFSDGTVKEVGVVVGKDGTNGIDGVGRDGKDAAPVDMLAVKSIVLEAVAQIPKPKDGKDGADGLGFEDMEVVQSGVRGVTLKFARGERVKSFDLTFPAMLYRGVYEPSTTYEPGDVVTRQGSMWHCHAETSDLPGEGSKSWQLCVKRGSAGPKGEQGPKGVSVTRDLTQMDPNTGAKW